MNGLATFKHLLPRGRVWRITVDKVLRRFFQGLAGTGEDAKTFIDEVFEDIDPQKTRELDAWEQQFALPATVLTEQERRDRLDATWKALGGQDPRYIQDTLQAAGFPVCVHEWWEPIPGRPLGGSIAGDVTPVARNPFDYLDDGSGGVPFLMFDGADDGQDGDEVAMDGSTGTPVGYPIVNKVLEAVNTVIGDGSPTMMDGSGDAEDGGIVTVYDQKQYFMPADAATFPYYLYIGGETFPEQVTLPSARRDEFEDLCLKICPLEQWIGVIVNYS